MRLLVFLCADVRCRRELVDRLHQAASDNTALQRRVKEGEQAASDFRCDSLFSQSQCSLSQAPFPSFPQTCPRRRVHHRAESAQRAAAHAHHTRWHCLLLHCLCYVALGVNRLAQLSLASCCSPPVLTSLQAMLHVVSSRLPAAEWLLTLSAHTPARALLQGARAPHCRRRRSAGVKLLSPPHPTAVSRHPLCLRFLTTLSTPGFSSSFASQLFVQCSLPHAEQRRLVVVAHACAPAAPLHKSHALLFWRWAVDAALGGRHADVCIGVGSRLCKHSRFYSCVCCCRCHCRGGWRRSGAKRAQKRNCKLAGATFAVKALNWTISLPLSLLCSPGSWPGCPIIERSALEQLRYIMFNLSKVKDVFWS